MQKHGYIGEFEYADDHRSRKIVVELNGRLNKCGVTSPRFDVGVKYIEPWTARLLPSRQVWIYYTWQQLMLASWIMKRPEGRMLVVKYLDSFTRWSLPEFCSGLENYGMPFYFTYEVSRIEGLPV
ncbi:hypothetical protein IFM89_002336 [Coptis chinensis]|uniref:Uncharacterized protein n=1 Tax=Coptis chinensis TaxID=261450 RepID=A0A835MCE8_9MAGN|nr:hypothetical protein IFM89_002336 [Coptis chinensis]